MWRIYKMYELRIILKDGKVGECVVWCNIINIYIDTDGIYFNRLNKPNYPYFILWDKIKHIKVVKK